MKHWREWTRGSREWTVVGATFLLVFGILAWFSLTSRGIGWPYLTGVLFIMAIYALFALGLSVEFGYAGLLNFGHVAFMGLGAYGMAIFSMRLEDDLVPFLTGWSVAGVLFALLAGLLMGALVLVPILLVVERALARRADARRRLLLAIALASVVALAVVVSILPMTEAHAKNAVVLLGVLVGVALAAFVGLVLGFPAIRLREDYLAIVMIGSAEILRSFALNEEWLTRGTLGIIRLQRPVVEWALNTPWWRDVADVVGVRAVPLAHTTLAVLAVALAFLLLETLARSPWGRVLKAIREDEDVAAALGKNVSLYKLQALMIGSGVAAIAGILFVWNVSNVFPEHFLPIITFFAFIILVLGGVGNHKAALLGSIILWGIFEISGNLTVLQQYGLDLAGPLQAMFVGLALVLVMLFRPQGAVGRKEEMVLGK